MKTKELCAIDLDLKWTARLLLPRLDLMWTSGGPHTRLAGKVIAPTRVVDTAACLLSYYDNIQLSYQDASQKGSQATKRVSL